MLMFGLLNCIFLFLVTGQAFQIKGDLEANHSVYYLLNFISDSGFNLALWYVLGVSCVSLVLTVVSPGYRKGSTSEQGYLFAPTKWFYVILFFSLCILSGILIFAVVGLSEFLHSSRPGFQSGSTIFLVLLFLGVVPVLLKITNKGKIGTGDITCCLLSFAITGAFSRTNLILYLVIILIALYYSRGWADAPLTPKLIGSFLFFGFAVAFIVVVIGALHDAQNFVSGSMEDLIEFALANPQKSILSIQYDYRVGIEGMSGISGAFTEYLSHPDMVRPDYGSSWMLKGLTQSLPGFIKTYASGLIDLSDSLNWYPYSIVATGAESFFVGFGWFAVALYPVAVYVLGWYLPLLAVRTPLSPLLRIVAYLLTGCTIFFVHGPLAVWIGFSLSFSVVVVVFWPFFQRYIVTARASSHHLPTFA